MDIDKIIDISKKRGIVFPSSEIYGGMSGFFDYGPVGLKIKRRIEESWREFFIKSVGNIYEVQTALVMPEAVWEASGHTKDFIDPLVSCKKCNSVYRADDLIQEITGKIVEGKNAEELTKIIKEEKIKCQKCKSELGDVKVFHLMLKTQVGPTEGNIAYLRPETAQGIFVNFKNILNSTRTKLPFGVAQIGTSYRNEISPRHFIMRLREFNQMEIEIFFDPNEKEFDFEKFAKTKLKILKRDGKEVEINAEDAVKKEIIPTKWQAYFMAKQMEWYQKLGIPKEKIHFRHMKPEETPHYSKGNFDLEIEFDFGWKEVVGNAYRTDFDLGTHSKHAKTDMSFVTDDGKKFIPHVVEPSFGIDRTIYAILLHSFHEGKDREWEFFSFPKEIAPFTAAVYPLVSKDKLPEKAREIFEMLKKDFDVLYDQSGSIGKRYARADEIGVPFAITIDYDTLKDDSVTVRDRDTTKQKRIKIRELPEYLKAD
jgi:glycyl-tRNA synthetase